MFERILVGGKRSPAFVEPLTDNHAIRLKVSDPLFVSTNNGIAVRFDEAIHELFDLAFELRQLGLHRLALLFHRVFTLLPKVPKEGSGEPEEFFGWLQRFEQRLKLLFDDLASDGLAFL
ncbi:hypothetical protein [Alloyangia pacifica]|uniref:hypothetical protein n=1 Tax=Alloyangia pacifica TaxID=311180 RepID=UPI0018822E08|nr:hypothetical protein [Alloyangia pacifica]